MQKARGVKGLRGASRKDAAIWEELRNDLDRLGPESEQLVHDLFTDDPAADVDVVSGDHVRVGPPRGPTQRRSLVTVRRGQQFFRQTVLAAYEVRCCITGIALPELLVASHILPWRDFPEQRLNPANGLCLSRLHDGAFDSGLITLDEDLRVVLGRAIRERLPQPALETSFVAYEGRPIVVSSKIAEPDGAFLEYHREHVFRG